MNPLLLLLLFALPWTGAQAAESVARVVALSGSAEVIRGADQSRQALQGQDAIFLNDRLITAARSQVKLLLRDDSVLKIAPQSELLIDAQLLGPGNESRTTLKLLKGKLRAFVGKQLGANSRFEVHTSVAVAGVRGTDFEVLTVNPSLVRCYTGRVGVKNSRADIKGEVILTPNTFTRVYAERPPSPPEFIPPGENLYRRAQEAEDKEEKIEDEETADRELSEAEAEEVEEGLLKDGQLPGAQPSPSSPDALQDDLLYGDPNEGQLDTIEENPSPGMQLPLDIRIPSP